LKWMSPTTKSRPASFRGRFKILWLNGASFLQRCLQ
jgi:hypothetical protein